MLRCRPMMRLFRATLQLDVRFLARGPTTLGGFWDAEQYEVAAILKRDGKTVSELELDYAGETSQFQGRLEIRKAGAYEVTVYAHDPENGNTGVDKTTFILAAPGK